MIPQRLLRRAFGLAAAASPVESELRWVETPDGVRLATLVLHPRGRPIRSPALLLRTPFGLRGFAAPEAWLARVLAGEPWRVVLQATRGRYESEGHFEPFVDETRDARATIEWLSGQRWFDGRLALAGVGYSAFAAWAALAAAAPAVRALVSVSGGRFPHAGFFAGGAVRLARALDWALALGGRSRPRERGLDRARALRHRPPLAADRVAWRELSAFRAWLAHPCLDGFWRERTAPAVSAPPATLVIGSWTDPDLPAQLEAFGDATGAGGDAEGGNLLRVAAAPALSLEGRSALLGLRELAGQIRSFLACHLLGEAAALPAPPVRLTGPDWTLEARTWPPSDTKQSRLFLHSAGQANTLAGDGLLDSEEPGSNEPPDRFLYDPLDPVPSLGDPRAAFPPAHSDQRAVEVRRDVLCYTSRPLDEPLEAIGPAELELHAASSTPDSDFTAKLVDVAPDGRAQGVGEGIVRARWRGEGTESEPLPPRQPVRLRIALGVIGHRFARGHRLRLEVSSSSAPRFDPHPNTFEDPVTVAWEGCRKAEQLVLHEAAHPSCLRLRVRSS